MKSVKRGIGKQCLSFNHRIMNKLLHLIFVTILMAGSLLYSGRKYPDWFVFPGHYKGLVTGYNYRDVNIYSDAAATFCVLENCVVRGKLYQYADTDKRFSDYYYYYDQNRCEEVLDSLIHIKTYVLSTFPLSLVSVFSMEKVELNEEWYDFDIIVKPVWTEKNFFIDEGYYYGVGVYTSSGNDIDAWKTAEERSFFSLLTGVSTRISSEKRIYIDEDEEYYGREQSIDCEYKLRDLQICERYANNEDDLFYVLSRIEKRNIKLAK